MNRFLRFLTAAAMVASVSCACNDSTLMSGAGNDFRPCGMSCIDRDGRSCKCSGQCPCWIGGMSGKRRHKIRKRDARSGRVESDARCFTPYAHAADVRRAD